ncbi:unnamed protein product [Phytophthora fragariaefolia]|uniref:Unnamed protein product n=1 Tax=Phytophthora fragariaefolia TaxID=1490495 RepID=A0A9W6YHJ0_9STRA|nr:unnamed protein product [Phytophthora fragariaefolia]
MVSGRRRVYALPDDGYNEPKINSRSRSPGLRTKPSGCSNLDSAPGGTTRHQVIAYLICTQKVLPDSKYSQAKILTTDQDHQPGFAAHRLPPGRPPDGRHDYATSDHSETKIKETAFSDIHCQEVRGTSLGRRNWFPGTYVIIEYSQLQTVPSSLLRIAPNYLSLAGNPINNLPPEIFEIEGLTDLDIGATNIRGFPENVTQLSSTLTTIFVAETSISYFWSWIDNLLGRTSIRGVPRSIYAGATLYCRDLESIKNGSALSFTAFPEDDFSFQLMDVAKASSDGAIWSWVDCNSTVSGFSGPLYPLIADDTNNAIGIGSS